MRTLRTGAGLALAGLLLTLAAPGAATAAPPIIPPPFGAELPDSYGQTPRVSGNLGPMPQLPPAPRPVPFSAAAGGEYAQTVLRVPVNGNVVFITIDDGGYQPPEAARVLEEAHIPTSLFLISSPAVQHADFFRSLQPEGATIEAHTQSHRKLKGLPEDVQRFEICGSVDKLQGVAGRRPTLFRPPYGEYDLTTLKVIQSCGGIAANTLWEGSVIGGTLYIAQHAFGPHNPLYPGMILLMHFTPDFERDMHVLLAAVAASPGFSVGRLEDYIH
ncbi:polysaccharide deacetylase family protein [Fodinicola feengrottensis]|uniref:NodB homology domain-containing protein n=1 Tax=Fodinicola feengrottensis TaxID=435914 RepID=A0ABN2HII2_9ACTN|nr:polysaccharide deacetylase family protein [Fodinicola feengrottensis]